MESSSKMTAAARYESLRTEREPYLRRARDASRLTIPSIIPEEGSTGTTQLDQPYQSVGARGVNNLVAKLMLAMFPPGSPFFRLSITDKITGEAEQAGMENAEQVFEEALAGLERRCMERFEASNVRPVLHSSLKHLVVGGNGLVHRSKAGWRLHPLSHYVCKRDPEGNVLDIVVKEGLSKMTLPEPVRLILLEKQALLEKATDASAERTIDLYTRITREGKMWTVYQEVVDTEVPGTRSSHPLDRPHFLPLRWSEVEGESYGRGHVEEYIGDLASLESLSQSVIDFAAAASKILWLVSTGGVTDPEDLEKAPSGSFVEGDARDVTSLQLDKIQDFQIADSVAQRIEKRLEQAFLLTSSIQRNAERVTAEEIRIMASELEQALGGVYSNLSAELQRPLVQILLGQLKEDGDLGDVPKDALHAKIVTGLDGLGRQGDLVKWDILVSKMAETFGPQAVSEYVSVGAYTRKKADALGLDITGVIRSDEEVQAARQEQQDVAMQAQMAGPTIGAMKDMAVESSRQQAAASNDQGEV